ncbi:MAG: branched-chain amino acid aminotransferase [Deltaproteobacteria bacterium]|nr:branched-chain amino acid aminotransferase [Deltaproteobacteria bacterium]
MINIKIERRPEDKLKPKPKLKYEKGEKDELGFGKYFSDHMFLMDYTKDEGWNNARIVPYDNLPMDPAAMVFHYGQAIFEGLKAYRGEHGKIYLFRARNNFERFNRSAKRLCMPRVDIDVALRGLKELIKIDKDWIPDGDGMALYIRPTMIATEPALGVRPSNTYLFFIIVGPVGAYYPEGFNPVKIYVSDKYVRAVRGGLGEAKTGANYAHSLYAAEEAKQLGFTQVLWLDAIHMKYVEEVGTMNIFFYVNDELITSPLTGSILPGITRDSVIRIARDWGYKVSERLFSIDELIHHIEKGEVREIFGTGTAAIISPVGELYYKGKNYTIADGKVGELSRKLYEYIQDLQYGKKPDPYEWVEQVI